MKTDYLRETHHEFLAAVGRGAGRSAAAADSRPARRHAGPAQSRGLGGAAKFGSDSRAGRAIKDQTLAELDEHLTKLERSVTARGGHVHWADDGRKRAGSSSN